MKLVLNILSRLKSMPELRKLSGNAFWSIFGTASAKFIVLLAGIACANVLGTEGFGELGLVRSTVNTFVVLGTAGIGITATKYIAQHKKSNPDLAQRVFSLTSCFSLTLGILISGAVCICADYICSEYIGHSEIVTSLQIGALLIFVTIINSVVSGALAGFENFKAIAGNTFISSVVESGFIVTGAYYYGAWGAILGFSLGIGILLILNLVSLSKSFSAHGLSFFNFHFCREDWRILVSFSLPAALSSLLVAPSYWVVRTMLARFNGLSELGIYEAADQWRVIILFVPAALSNIVMPSLARHVHSTQIGEYKRMLKLNLIINGLVSSALSLIVILCSSYLMLIYGDGFEDSSILILVALSTVFSSIATVVGVSIMSRGRVWIGFAYNLLWSCMFVGGTYLFLSLGYGAIGLAWALVISYALHTIIQSIYLYNILRKYE